jgi:hypothetical protein
MDNVVFGVKSGFLVVQNGSAFSQRSTQRVEARSRTLWNGGLFCRTGALEFALVHRESRLLLRFPLSFHFLQRLASLRVLALFFRQRL